MALDLPIPWGGNAYALPMINAAKTKLTEMRMYGGSAVWDPGSLVAAAQESKDFTVTGAALGDFAIAGAGVDVTDLMVSAVVTAANVVTVTLNNATAGTINLASSTWGVLVFSGPF